MMRSSNSIYRSILLTLGVVLTLLCSGVMAVTRNSVEESTIQPRTVQLSGGESYVDHVGFMTEEQEVDLLVKLFFDEDANSVRVSLLSCFTLVGFEQDVRYGSIMKFHKFRYDKVPYVMESDPAAKYKTTNEFRSSMKPHKRKTIISNWVEAKGASFEMGRYEVVNDYLERCYNFGEGVDDVEITLRDILVLESPAKVRKRGVKYKLFAKQDLNTTYSIELKRDPCRGAEAAAETASLALSNIMASYKKLSEMQGAQANNSSRDSLKIFNILKDAMMEQYVVNSSRNSCPDVMRSIESYNSYVDSISMVNGYYVAPELDAQVVYDAAKEVDRYNTRWSLTSDQMERDDIEEACGELIHEMEAKISKLDTMSDKLSRAVDLFWRAESNFRFITNGK